MPRPLTAIALAVTVLAAAAAGCGGGGDDEASATPAPAPSGFVNEQGDDWAFARPEAWSRVDTADQPEGKELKVFQTELEARLPSQVGIGVSSDYQQELGTAVRVARDMASTRFPSYEIKEEGRIDVAGAQAFKIDATYDSFGDDPTPIRIVDLYVQTPDKRQMNFFVRGPVADWERLGLEQIVASFRVL